MCGIVAIFNVKEQTPELRSKALGMSKKIRHRGPDWSGIPRADSTAALSAPSPRATPNAV